MSSLSFPGSLNPEAAWGAGEPSTGRGGCRRSSWRSSPNRDGGEAPRTHAKGPCPAAEERQTDIPGSTKAAAHPAASRNSNLNQKTTKPPRCSAIHQLGGPAKGMSLLHLQGSLWPHAGPPVPRATAAGGDAGIQTKPSEPQVHALRAGKPCFHRATSGIWLLNSNYCKLGALITRGFWKILTKKISTISKAKNEY